MNIDPSWPSLTSAEAKKLAAEGKANTPPQSAAKTTGQIWFSNLFTFYNILNIVLAVLVFTTGSYRNMFFLNVVLANFLIGTIQELRAKKTVESLSVLTSPAFPVIRDGKTVVLPSAKLVLGDVLFVGAGDQLTADGVLLAGEATFNESLLTGEGDAVSKRPGDPLFSGSFVVSGEGAVKLTAVGADCYAERLTAEARRYKEAQSVLKTTMTKIIKTLSLFLIPFGLVTFYNHFVVQGLSYVDSMLPSVAATIGMVPDGLYLLTGMSFALGVINLAKKRTLVQQLYSLENLARADVLCLDKTGTITSGRMTVRGVLPLSDGDIGRKVAELFTAVPADNPTAKALVAAFSGKGDPNRKAVHTLPFSSAKKYTAVTFADGEALMLGAPAFVLGDGFPELRQKAKELSADGTRVLLLTSAKRSDDLYKADKPLGFILIEDEIRPHVADTFAYFEKNGVSIKVISGDDPGTVSAIAQKAGVSGAERFVDASRLSDEELFAIADETVVFGRVAPEQKRLLVKALQKAGHTVAMTGDGVNDVLALKDADCSVAMASGAQAARHVSQLVLLDSDFSALPSVVLEGRRVINNIQRSASLFLMKTTYAVLLAATLLFVPLTYPFAPIQLTLIGGLVSGIPGVLLALEPNFKRVPDHFMSTVLKKAFISGGFIFLGILAVLIFGGRFGLSDEEISTVAVLYTGTASLLALLRACQPLNRRKALLVLACAAVFFFAMEFLDGLFLLVPLGKAARLLLLALLPLALLPFLFDRPEKS